MLPEVTGGIVNAVHDRGTSWDDYFLLPITWGCASDFTQAGGAAPRVAVTGYGLLNVVKPTPACDELVRYAIAW